MKVSVLTTTYNRCEELEELVHDPIEVSSSDLSDQLNVLNENLVKASANQKYTELMDVVQKQKLKI